MTEFSPFGKTHFDVRRPLHPNPGLARDFMDGPISSWEHKELWKESATRALLERDSRPIPAAADRENYYDDRHLEYWLSGLQDSIKLGRWLPQSGPPARYLDFGGSTGRVARHMAQLSSLDVWLCDINVNWIDWVDLHLGSEISAFQNRIIPSLPLADGYFDLVSAFSVFTHLDHDEIPWLLELRRIVRAGGYVYVTILDESVWEKLKNPDWDWLFKSIARGRNDETLREQCRSPLHERVVLQYSDAEAYNVNVFLPQAYIKAKWGRLFRAITFFPDQHNYQTVVVLECP